jgi:hypothetical protein
MISVKLFPVVLIFLDLAAAAVYLCNKDIKHAIYWTAAAILTASVTF